MRFGTTGNNLLVRIAIASVICTGAASAQSLVGANAQLNQSLDTKKLSEGQVVTAKLDESVKTADGVDLPRGAELIGKVGEVKPSQNDGPATLSLVFNTAKLKDGKQIPVKVTLISTAPPSDGMDNYGVAIGPPPQHVSDNASFQTSEGGGDVLLTSAVKNADSGTFTKSHGNFGLISGTTLQVAIAPAAEGSQTNAAE